jgi:hypothetical protein
MIRGFLPFFTTDETQCHHYGGRIVAHNASLYPQRLALVVFREVISRNSGIQHSHTPSFSVPSIRRDTVVGNPCGDSLDGDAVLVSCHFHCRGWSGQDET